MKKMKKIFYLPIIFQNRAPSRFALSPSPSFSPSALLDIANMHIIPFIDTKHL